jgi:hypothetical protein
MADIIFRYFKSVEGMVVPRYGTATFIGVKRDKTVGWVWDTARVVRIPESETVRYMKEYRRALADGAMVECLRADYDAQNAEVHEVHEDVTETVRRPIRRQKGGED